MKDRKDLFEYLDRIPTPSEDPDLPENGVLGRKFLTHEEKSNLVAGLGELERERFRLLSTLESLKLKESVKEMASDRGFTKGIEYAKAAQFGFNICIKMIGDVTDINWNNVGWDCSKNLSMVSYFSSLDYAFKDFEIEPFIETLQQRLEEIEVELSVNS